MRTNLTYQPQPALCYISKISALGVTTGWLLVNNIHFKNHCAGGDDRDVSGWQYTILNLCAWRDDRTVADWKYTIQNHYARSGNRDIRGQQYTYLIS